MNVKQIKRAEAAPFILNKHYLGRMPSVSWAFGLFDEQNNIVGVVTFGKPASNNLCEGICGVELKSKVYELNRLYVEDGMPKNTASWFVSRALKMLPNDLIIVSYADSAMNHHGYIYQALSFIYTGETKARTDVANKSGHSRHYTEDDRSNGYRKERSAKYRYVKFLDSKMVTNLKYPTLPYPKGENKKYVVGVKVVSKIITEAEGEPK